MLSRLVPSLLALVVAACTSGGAGEEDGSSSSSGGTDPTSSSSFGEASSSSSTGEPCPLGANGCPCTAGGACDGELACLEGNICGSGCALGSLGCSCTEGGGCDGGLVCDAAICIEGVSETCGDGQVDVFEECDLGKENSDAGACTMACKTAVCGDNLVGPGEACDGGEGCTEGCSLSSCGNGMLDKGEECEPASADDVECSAICTDARKVIFVTSEMYKGGEIGGVAGGDAKCQALADKAGLPGVFLSWLATSEEDAPLVRFAWKEGVPYVDAAGEQLAKNWHGIYTNGAPPHLTESAQIPPLSELEFPSPKSHQVAWASGLEDAGGVAPYEATCGLWSSVASIGPAARLDADNLRAAWGKADCNLMAPILCVEQ